MANIAKTIFTALPFLMACSPSVDAPPKKQTAEVNQVETGSEQLLSEQEKIYAEIQSWMAANSVPSPACQTSSFEYPELASELAAMGQLDQSVRSPDGDLLDGWENVDTENSSRLKEVFREYSWPDVCMVGPEASQGAFLVLQHTQDEELRRLGIKLFEAKLEAGLVHPSSYAYLKDRDLMDAGEPQVYGTQYTCDKREGSIRLWETVNIDKVDERRESVELFPIDLQNRLVVGQEC